MFAAIGAVVARAVSVEIQRVLTQLEASIFGDSVLALFNFCVEKFLDFAALQADKVVVVAAFGEFEHRFARLEVVPLKQACLLELGQDPIHSRQPDVHAIVHQCAVNIFRSQMPLVRALKEIENLQARIGRLESDVLQVF